MAAQALTPKQQRFVSEYLQDLNATAAYKRAGYKARSDGVAASSASDLLRIPKVAAAIATAEAERAQRTGIDADRVLAEIAHVAFSDIGQVLDFTGVDPHLRPARDIPEAARRAISSIKVRRTLEGSEADAREVEVTEFRLWSKSDALEKLCKHLGLYKERDPLEILLVGLEPRLAAAIRTALGRVLPTPGDPPGAAAGGA